jgi:hypothetical protein
LKPSDDASTPDSQGDGATAAVPERSRSHQIRNALNAARLQLTLLEHELTGAQLSDDAKHAIAAIKAQIALIAELIVDARDEGLMSERGKR